jgi:hypothetical protein
MKKITKPFIAIALIAAVFTSCSKSKDVTPTTSTFMKLTINGTATSFNSCLEADAEINGVMSQVLITGNNFTNGKPAANSFEVDINHDPATLKAGQTFAVSGNTQPNSIALFYFLNDSDYFVTQGKSTQGTITLTKVTSTVIEGTFSGKLFDPSDFSSTKVLYTATSGSFSAKRN